jgi:hypothetical protein
VAFQEILELLDNPPELCRQRTPGGNGERPNGVKMKRPAWWCSAASQQGLQASLACSSFIRRCVRCSSVLSGHLGSVAACEPRVRAQEAIELVKWRRPCTRPPLVRVRGLIEFTKMAGVGTVFLKPMGKVLFGVRIEVPYGLRVPSPYLARTARNANDSHSALFPIRPFGCPPMV